MKYDSIFPSGYKMLKRNEFYLKNAQHIIRLPKNCNIFCNFASWK